MTTGDPIVKELPDEARQALRRCVTELKTLLEAEPASLVLFGSAARGEYLPGRSNLNLLIVPERVDVALLRRLAQAWKRWSRDQILAPLVLTRAELAVSARLFPLECLDLLAAHVLLAGDDPFRGLEVEEAGLHEACERELRNNVLRLRQRVLEGGGGEEAMSMLLCLSTTSAVPALRGLLRLRERPIPRSSDAVIQEAAAAWGFDPLALHEGFKLKRGLISPGPKELPRLFQRHLEALDDIVQRLAGARNHDRMQGRLGS